MLHRGAHLHDRRDFSRRTLPKQRHDLKRPRVPLLDGDLVAELDWKRDESRTEVVGGEVAEDADCDPGRHRYSMAQ